MRPHPIVPIRRVSTQVTVGTRNGMTEDMFRDRCASITVVVGAVRRRVTRSPRSPAPVRGPSRYFKVRNSSFRILGQVKLNLTPGQVSRTPGLILGDTNVKYIY